MQSLFRRILQAAAIAGSGLVFGLSSCVRTIPPEWVECLRNCNP